MAFELSFILFFIFLTEVVSDELYFLTNFERVIEILEQRPIQESYYNSFFYQ